MTTRPDPALPDPGARKGRTALGRSHQKPMSSHSVDFRPFPTAAPRVRIEVRQLGRNCRGFGRSLLSVGRAPRRRSPRTCPRRRKAVPMTQRGSGRRMGPAESINWRIERGPVLRSTVTVPGPRQPRFLLGARIRRVAPVLPLTGNLDISIAILSYDTEVSFGCFADADRCADLQPLSKGIRRSVGCLVNRASARDRVGS